MTRQYTETERAKAIGLGLTRGSIVAAQETGIPRRTISRWLASPDAVVLRAETREEAAELFRTVAIEAATEARARVHDPKTRAGELAQIFREMTQAHALLTGQATQRTEALNVNVTRVDMTAEQVAAGREWLDEVLSLDDAGLADWAASGGLAEIRDAARLTEGSS